MIALALAVLCSLQEAPAPESLRGGLEAPLLFVKRHSFKGLHIYDTYYKWDPGGGIYILENPADPPARRRIRALVDPSTPGSPGAGVYTHPELSWDASRVVFCFKGSPKGCTSIYEVGIDGRGLRRLTDPSPACGAYKGVHAGIHDVAPVYLPDGRIAFTSTRPQGLVPCANEGVNILHVMNGDGSDVRPISVNPVNEFDPAVMPDGRIVYGRWEYVDKTALTQQGLWSVFPDGTQETAVYANNMAVPEAVLDPRPVPGRPELLAVTLAPHNAPPRGTVAIVDTRMDKNDPAAIRNFEFPAEPTRDRGDSCEPWPLSEDLLLFSGRPKGRVRNVLELIHRDGRRELLLDDPDICLHSPMLVKPRPRPAAVPDLSRRELKTGAFLVQDVTRGLEGVRPGDARWIRVVEETSRVSPSPGGAFNQTFVVSAVLAWSVKNVLGVAPVEADGSAHFEAPSGRALYFQVLDAEGRMLHGMRTFVQAVPGTTRSCVGCHEPKRSGASSAPPPPSAVRRPPSALRPESWGSGPIDYPSRVQPVLDRRCTSCHGGAGGFAGGLDLSGGWTEYFSNSYESLTSRRGTQLRAHLIAGMDTMNGTSLHSSKILPPGTYGSGGAPLARLLVEGHGGRLADLTREERDLLLAWIDTNGVYHGSWDYTAQGPRVAAWTAAKDALLQEMKPAGCLRCHDPKRFETDWINLQRPEWSRILRAPLAAGGPGLGVAACRARPTGAAETRLRMLLDGVYHHGIRPLETFERAPSPPPPAAPPAPSFASEEDPRYRAMLAVIRRAREQALAVPRQDMPGAPLLPGAPRLFVVPDAPAEAPALSASVGPDGAVELSWPREALTFGLEAELHRAPPGAGGDFVPNAATLLASTTLGRRVDPAAPPGPARYALVIAGDRGTRSRPSRVSVLVPETPAPAAPRGLAARVVADGVELTWSNPHPGALTYEILRDGALLSRTATSGFFVDRPPAGAIPSYRIRAVDRRGRSGPESDPVR